MPMVFMTYANVVFSYGAKKFISACREIEIGGLILPDLPFEEKEEFHSICSQYGVDLISLIAPTSKNRIAMIAKEAEGFIYIVSSLGVTGVRSEIKTDLDSIVKVIRENTDVPCAIGFGISTPEQAKKMADISDGAIVGSAIIRLLEKHGKEAPDYIGEYVKIHEERHRVNLFWRIMNFGGKMDYHSGKGTQKAVFFMPEYLFCCTSNKRLKSRLQQTASPSKPYRYSDCRFQQYLLRLHNQTG